MLETWFPVMLLALESSEVIGLRVAKLAGGGVGARHEAHLMVSEKIDAVIEAGAGLLCGATAINVINRFREYVMANAKRLSTESRLAPAQATEIQARSNMIITKEGTSSLVGNGRREEFRDPKLEDSLKDESRRRSIKT